MSDSCAIIVSECMDRIALLVKHICPFLSRLLPCFAANKCSNCVSAPSLLLREVNLMQNLSCVSAVCFSHSCSPCYDIFSPCYDISLGITRSTTSRNPGKFQSRELTLSSFFSLFFLLFFLIFYLCTGGLNLDYWKYLKVISEGSSGKEQLD